MMAIGDLSDSGSGDTGAKAGLSRAHGTRTRRREPTGAAQGRELPGRKGGR